MEVIVVEDEPIAQKRLISLLEKLGYTVFLADDGNKAWQLFREKRAQLIISGWMMPGFDGLELCKKIESFKSPHYIYQIALLDASQQGDLSDVFQSGIDDFVFKPFDDEELKYRINIGHRMIKQDEQYNAVQTTIVKSRNKIMDVFDAMHECIVAIDDQYKIISANRSFFHEVGEEINAVIGKDFFPLDTEKKLPWGNKHIQSITDRVFLERKAEYFLEKTIDKNRSTRYFKYHLVPIINEMDKVVQVVIISRDITIDIEKTNQINSLNNQLLDQKKQIEEKNIELRQTLKKLEDTQSQIIQSEKMASIGQLAAGVAHEINNPTGFVSSNLKTLVDYQNDINGLILLYQKLISDLKNKQNGNISPKVLTVIDDIKDAEDEMDVEFVQEDIMDLIGDCREGTDRIKKIVNDLKQFAHPGEDKLQDTDINHGIESTLNVVSNELKYIASVTKEFGDIPLIKANPQQLNQVFMNILVNAAQAMKAKGEIVIKTQNAGSFVEVIINDTGIGIPEENILKIFDPFFTTKDVGKGTGLGMHIAFNIIKKYNGTINVESEVGKGTTFTVRLPKG